MIKMVAIMNAFGLKILNVKCLVVDLKRSDTTSEN
jgi:hypothetical protein